MHFVTYTRTLEYLIYRLNCVCGICFVFCVLTRTKNKKNPKITITTTIITETKFPTAIKILTESNTNSFTIKNVHKQTKWKKKTNKQQICFPTEDDPINGGASKCHENCSNSLLYIFRLLESHLSHAIAPLNDFPCRY